MHPLVIALLAAAPAYVPLTAGVIYVDAPRPTFFAVANPQGVEAIDARTGEVEWRDAKAAYPLLRHGSVLLVTDSATPRAPARLVALDLATGRRRFELSSPPGAAGLLLGQNGMGARVQVSAFRQGEDDWVMGSQTRCHVGGAALRNPPPCQTSSVTLRIDWKTRSAVPADATPPTPRQVGKFEPPNRRIGIYVTASGAPSRSVQEDNGDVVYHPPAGSAVVLIQRAGHASLWPTLSADGAAISGFGQREGGADREGRVTYDAAFFDAETGAASGSCAVHEPLAPFLLRGKRVFSVWARHLTALELKSCRLVYSRAVRDLEYRGAYPP